MNDSKSGAPPPNWDWYEKDAACYPPYSTRWPTPVTVLTPGTGTMGIQGQAATSQVQSTTGRGEVTAPPVRLAKPPRLWPSFIARMLTSKKRYRTQWEPLIADMNDEYFECLAVNDQWGARRAVIRANVNAIPRWVWALTLSLKLHLLDWIRTHLGI